MPNLVENWTKGSHGAVIESGQRGDEVSAVPGNRTVRCRPPLGTGASNVPRRRRRSVQGQCRAAGHRVERRLMWHVSGTWRMRTAPVPAFPQVSGRFRRWALLGSNQ